jgi:hypothetical protein
MRESFMVRIVIQRTASGQYVSPVAIGRFSQQEKLIFFFWNLEP